MSIFSLLPRIYFLKIKIIQFLLAQQKATKSKFFFKKISKLQLIVKHLNLNFNLNHMPKIRSARMMNQVIISTVGYTENRTLTKKLLVLCPLHFLLPPQFHYLPVWIWMLCWHKCGASSGSVFGYQPTRLIADPTCITQSFRTHWPSPPLWGLLWCTVQTFSNWITRLRIHHGVRTLTPHGRCLRGHVEETCRPITRRSAWPLGPGFTGQRGLREENRVAGFRACGFKSGWRWRGCGCKWFGSGKKLKVILL